MVKKYGILAVAAGASFLFVAEAGAAVLSADFNDITAGTLNGKAGGTGFTGNWAGSAGGTVAANDLTSSLYDVPQSGTAQRFRNANATGLRQNYRTPAASPTGTIWFSFLAMAEATGDQAGLSINAPTGTPFDNTGNSYAYLVGDTLNYQFGSTTTPGTVPGAATVGSTVLIVGQFTITAGADPIKLWVNPNLVANPDINAYTPVYNDSTTDWISSIGNVGVIGARFLSATSGGGNVDNIRFSDGGGNANQAFVDVTGVPEPTSLLAIASIGTLGLLRRSRRRG